MPKRDTVIRWIRCVVATGFMLAVSIQRPYAFALTRADGAQRSDYEIRIGLEKPILRLYRNGQLERTYPVALGKPSTPTPIGDFTIVDKQKNWGGGFGSRWLGLDVPWGTYGIHGTNRPWSIGKYASNGCIRMLNQDVEQLYDTVPTGTRVLITGNPLQNPRKLVFGNIGTDVQLVQQKLKEAGYFRGIPNGRFDTRTAFGLVFFELAHRLPMDGVVDRGDYQVLGLLP